MTAPRPGDVVTIADGVTFGGRHLDGMTALVVEVHEYPPDIAATYVDVRPFVVDRDGARHYWQRVPLTFDESRACKHLRERFTDT